MISVITLTTRPGIFRVGREALEAQSFKDFEWVVVDALYDQRKDAVAEYMKDFAHPFLHLPDPPHEGYRYGLSHANNEGIRKSKGDLIVFLQDFIIPEEHGLQKYYDLHQKEPNAISSGVDDRFFAQGDMDKDNPIDIFQFKPWTKGETDYTNVRAQLKEITESRNAFDFEMNWCATPRKVAEDIGGFMHYFSHGIGFDNTEFALRAIMAGHKLFVDPTNIAHAMNHWVMFPPEHVGYIIGREEESSKNDGRYLETLQNLQAGRITPYDGDLFK